MFRKACLSLLSAGHSGGLQAGGTGVSLHSCAQEVPLRTQVAQGGGLGAIPASFLCRFLYRNSLDVVLEKSPLSQGWHPYREGKADTWDDLIMSQKALGCPPERLCRIVLFRLRGEERTHPDCRCQAFSLPRLGPAGVQGALRTPRQTQSFELTKPGL